MGIIALDIKKAMEPQLGVFATQRYLDVPHYIPAIQGAQRRLNGLAEAVFAENKGGEEIFLEITESRVFQTDAFGSIRFIEAELGHKMWSIAAIYPTPQTEPTGSPMPMGPNQYLRPDLGFIGSGPDFTRRITLEQSGPTQRNRFLPGNEVTAGGPRRTWAYYLTSDRAKLVPLSQSQSRVVAVSYLRTIQPIPDMSAVLPYPDRAFQLLVDLALNEISGRQGTVPLYERSLAEVRTLLQAQA